VQHFRGSLDIWDPALVDGPSGGQLQLSNIEVQSFF
jgi:hypothetical protein